MRAIGAIVGSATEIRNMSPLLQRVLEMSQACLARIDLWNTAGCSWLD